jgi:hypothetical protein
MVIKMTANDVYELALALIEEDKDSENEGDYRGKTPQLIDALQREIAFYEGVAPGKIKDMNDSLQISDDSAMRIMPYGLAALFALADRNADMQSDYSYMYRSLLRTIRPEETDIEDKYDILSGL